MSRISYEYLRKLRAAEQGQDLPLIGRVCSSCTCKFETYNKDQVYCDNCRCTCTFDPITQERNYCKHCKFSKADIPPTVTEHVISDTVIAMYESDCNLSYAKYEGIRETAWAEYNKNIDEALEAYETDISNTESRFKAVTGTALVNYEGERSKAWAEYVKQRTPLWGDEGTYLERENRAWKIHEAAKLQAETDIKGDTELAEYLYIEVSAHAMDLYDAVERPAYADYLKDEEEYWQIYQRRVRRVRGE